MLWYFILKEMFTMSVTVKRNTGYHTSMSNLAVKLNDVTLEKLAPGESTNFELPHHTEKIKIASSFASKEIEVTDGQTIDIVRNIPIIISKYILHLFIVLVLPLTMFGVINDFTTLVVLMIPTLMLYAYIYYFVPNFKLVLSSDHVQNR